MSNFRSAIKDMIQGNSYSRLWTWREDRLGFGSRPLVFFYLFLPHLGMAWGLFGTGIFGLLAWPFGFRFEDNGIHPLVCLMFIAFGGLFCSFLTPLLLGRRRIWIDRSDASVRLAYGLQLPLIPIFLPLFSEREAFSAFERAVLTQTTRSSGKNSYTTFAIELARRAGGTMPVADERGEVVARRIAEDVARLMGLPLQDVSSTQNALTRDSEKLDEPLRDRIQRLGAHDPPTAPPDLVAAYEVHSEGARVEVPRPPFRGGWVLRALLWCALSGALAYTLSWPYPERPIQPVYAEQPQDAPAERSLWPWRLNAAAWYLVRGVLIAAAVSVPVLIFELAMQELRRAPAGRIEANAAGLRIWKLGRVFGGETELPTRELEELRVESESGGKTYRLVAVTDRRFVRFGFGLSEREAQYLRAVLTRALAQ